MKRITFIIILSVVLASLNVFASKEGILNINKFVLESEGIGSSGPVKISGEKNQRGEFVSLTVEAFSQKYEISPENLAKIRETSFNGIQISYCGGYPELGGRVIYLIFQLGFIGRVDRRILLSLTEDGKIEVSTITLPRPRSE